jgi:hypothetical protein
MKNYLVLYSIMYLVFDASNIITSSARNLWKKKSFMLHDMHALN